MRRSRQRGVTLMELLISLVVIVVGMLVIFRVLATSIASGTASSRVAQAQQRAETIIEAIRFSPALALTCLETTAYTSWSTCETTCKSSQLNAPNTSASTCVYTIGTFSNIKGPIATNPAGGAPLTDQTVDRQGQQYFLIGGPTPNTPLPVYNSTYVRQVGDGLRTAEIQVSVAWNDDNSTAAAGSSSDGKTYPNHSVSLLTGVLQ